MGTIRFLPPALNATASLSIFQRNPLAASALCAAYILQHIMTHFANFIQKSMEETLKRLVACRGDGNAITVILLIAARYWGGGGRCHYHEMLSPHTEVGHVSSRLPTLIRRNALGMPVWFDIPHKRNDSNSGGREPQLSPHPGKLIN